MVDKTQVHSSWPALPWREWHETQDTLHMWMQIIGKIRLALATPVNHWWHVTLYPTCHGLTTSPMPYGNRTLQIDFDFQNHQLVFGTSDGLSAQIPLKSMSVADFYAQVMDRLEQLGMPVKIHLLPTEVANPIPFDSDRQHATYNPDYATRFWEVLLQSERVFNVFRARFLGKVSPVHFFWGGFDLAMTRFSGRHAPPHNPVLNTPDHVVQTAYSHEVSSCGFWPGGPMLPEAVFYAYAYPPPPGFADAPIRPKEAYFHSTLGEFVLPYDAVRQAENPDEMLLAFLQSTYDATANLAHWNRRELESLGSPV